MKLSHYNFFYPYKDTDKYIAYNSLSGALSLINKEEYELTKRFRENGNEIKNKELLDSLTDGEYLIADEMDELKSIKYSMLKSRYSSEILGLTIIPTSDCNFRCTYCYEKDVIKDLSMSSDIQQAILEYVKTKSQTIHYCDVTWFGGEPLLGINIIEELSEQIIRVCEDEKITYNSSIVTNGYLLTRETILTLKKLHINSIQITIDGSAITHNIRRPFKDGSPTFDVIINNLIECRDILPSTQIRINLDKDNIDSYSDVIDILRNNNLMDKIVVNVAPVKNMNNATHNDLCLTDDQYSDVNLRFLDYMKKERNFLYDSPKSRSHYCMADSDNGFLVDSDGEIYKCWTDTGKKGKSIGNILDSNIFSTLNEKNTYLDYLMLDPTNDKECSICKFLPICFGGCPNKRLDKRKECTFYKYSLYKILEHVVSYIKQQS